MSDPLMELPIAPSKSKSKDKKPLKSTISSVAASKKSKTIAVNDKIEPLQKVTLPEYVTKNWSGLALRGQNSNLKVCIRLK